MEYLPRPAPMSPRPGVSGYFIPTAIVVVVVLGVFIIFYVALFGVQPG